MMELPSDKPVQEIKKLLDDLLAFYQSQITCECLDCPWRTSFEKLGTLIPAVLESNDKYLELAHNQFLAVKGMDAEAFFHEFLVRIEHFGDRIDWFEQYFEQASDILQNKQELPQRRKEKGTYVVIDD